MNVMTSQGRSRKAAYLPERVVAEGDGSAVVPCHGYTVATENWWRGIGDESRQHLPYTRFLLFQGKLLQLN